MNAELRRGLKKDFEKDFFYVWKDHGKCKESQEYQNSDNWKKKK